MPLRVVSNEDNVLTLRLVGFATGDDEVTVIPAQPGPLKIIFTWQPGFFTDSDEELMDFAMQSGRNNTEEYDFDSPSKTLMQNPFKNSPSKSPSKTDSATESEDTSYLNDIILGGNHDAASKDVAALILRRRREDKARLAQATNMP